jgi:uncharacterized membrane protein YdjX (TVP38/TMEM64 family)
VLLILFKDVVSLYAVQFSKYARKHKIPGLAIMSGLHFVTSFPPIVGYGLLSYISGFIFGLGYGLIPVIVGAELGAIACFLAVRWYLSIGQSGEEEPLLPTQQLTGGYPHFELVNSIMSGNSAFKLLLIIRLSPYPFALFNMLFACTSLSFGKFAVGTLISLFKNVLNVYIGSLFHDLADIEHRSPEKSWALMAASAMATFLFFWLTWIVRQEFNIAQRERDVVAPEENRRRLEAKRMRRKELSRQRLAEAMSTDEAV